jgi:hypothetical protein
MRDQVPFVIFTELISNPTNGFARVADELVNLGGSRGQ